MPIDPPQLPPVASFRLLESQSYTISLERRARLESEAHWVISNGGAVLSEMMEWEHEPRSSSREDDFLRRTRCTLDEALKRWNSYVEANEPEFVWVCKHATFVYRANR